MSSVTIQVLGRWRSGEQPTSEELQVLLADELADSQRAKAFEITDFNGLETIKKRAQLFLAVYPEVLQLCLKLGFQSDEILVTLWTLWLPLALQLASVRKGLKRPLIQGILGAQGTGKTTLAEVCRLILSHLGYSTIGVSLDDLYKTYRERQRLQQEDPRLIWRGPPGTHDIVLGVQLLDQMRQSHRQEVILIPRFDKSLWNGAGDRIEPEKVEKVDIVLFEGWFTGVRPVAEKTFEKALPPITTLEDKQFARDTNERLKAYLPLWERLDRLIVLSPVDYRLSKQWRREAEQKMIASGKTGMSDPQIDQFVEYFWKALHPELFITPLTKNSDLVDLVIEINPHHCPEKIYKPDKFVRCGSL